MKKYAAEMAAYFLKGKLLVDADDNTGTDGTATLTDSETQAVLDGDGGDQLHVQ